MLRQSRAGLSSIRPLCDLRCWRFQAAFPAPLHPRSWSRRPGSSQRPNAQHEKVVVNANRPTANSRYCECESKGPKARAVFLVCLCLLLFSTRSFQMPSAKHKRINIKCSTMATGHLGSRVECHLHSCLCVCSYAERFTSFACCTYGLLWVNVSIYKLYRLLYAISRGYI